MLSVASTSFILCVAPQAQVSIGFSIVSAPRVNVTALLLFSVLCLSDGGLTGVVPLFSFYIGLCLCGSIQDEGGNYSCGVIFL